MRSNANIMCSTAYLTRYDACDDRLSNSETLVTYDCKSLFTEHSQRAPLSWLAAFAALSKQWDTLTAVHCSIRIHLRCRKPTRKPQLIVARSRISIVACTLYRYMIMYAISLSALSNWPKKITSQFSRVTCRFYRIFAFWTRVVHTRIPNVSSPERNGRGYRRATV